jgi:hypothetical protein
VDGNYLSFEEYIPLQGSSKTLFIAIPALYIGSLFYSVDHYYSPLSFDYYKFINPTVPIEFKDTFRFYLIQMRPADNTKTGPYKTAIQMGKQVKQPEEQASGFEL